MQIVRQTAYIFCLPQDQARWQGVLRKRLARSARSMVTERWILSTFSGATPAFSNLETILSRSDRGRSIAGWSVTRAARRKSVWVDELRFSPIEMAERRIGTFHVVRSHDIFDAGIERGAVKEKTQRDE